MTITPWPVEECRRRALQAFADHFELLDTWIAELSKQVRERLAPPVTPADAATAGVVLIAPRASISQLVALIARLSKDKVNATLLLVRQTFLAEEVAQKRANIPCAREAVEAAPTESPKTVESALKAAPTTRYSAATQTTTTPVRREFTPVRAPEPTVEEILRAHDEFAAGERNDAIRRERRQRTKDLRRAKLQAREHNKQEHTKRP